MSNPLYPNLKSAALALHPTNLEWRHRIVQSSRRVHTTTIFRQTNGDPGTLLPVSNPTMIHGRDSLAIPSWHSRFQAARRHHSAMLQRQIGLLLDLSDQSIQSSFSPLPMQCQPTDKLTAEHRLGTENKNRTLHLLPRICRPPSSLSSGIATLQRNTSIVSSSRRSASWANDHLLLFEKFKIDTNVVNLSPIRQGSHMIEMSPARRGSECFPRILHRALRTLELVEDGAQIATFLPDGNSFHIRNHFLFEKRVLPIFFPKMKGFASFQRQLNLYDFSRIGGSGKDRGAYCHKLFVRDFPAECSKMKRTVVKTKVGTRQVSALDTPTNVDPQPTIGPRDDSTQAE